MLTGNVLIYLVGLPWLAVVRGTGLERTLELGLYPFVPGDTSSSTSQRPSCRQHGGSWDGARASKPPMTGRVVQILVCPIATELPRPVERARAVAGRGLEGDRYFAGTGTWSDYPVQTGTDLTLIEAEVLDAVGLSGRAARRTLVTRGVRLNELVGRRFRIGAVECYGDRLCEPCSHLERLTGLPIEALVHRGGLRADILTDGEISVGDEIALGASSRRTPRSRRAR